MSNLKDIYKSRIYKTDKNTTHCYIDNYYNEKFHNIENSCRAILEIGVARGGSILLWHDFFKKAKVIGIDINLKKNEYDFSYNDRIQLLQQNAASSSVLDNKFHNIDIIIDDGSHRVEDQLLSFIFLYPSLRKGGIYIIEDIQNLDKFKKIFERVTKKKIKIFDFRKIKNRYDDIIIEIEK